MSEFWDDLFDGILQDLSAKTYPVTTDDVLAFARGLGLALPGPEVVDAWARSREIPHTRREVA